MVVRMEEDSIKHKSARVVTILSIDFADAQGQLTPMLEMVSCRNSIMSKLLLLSLLSERIKKIHSK